MRKNLRNTNIFLVNWNKLTPLLPQSLPVEPEWYISAIIKQVNPGEDPRDLMLISNYKIQSKQLLKVSQHFTHQVTVSVMFCTYLLSVLQVLQSRATFSVTVTIINWRFYCQCFSKLYGQTFYYPFHLQRGCSCLFQFTLSGITPHTFTVKSRTTKG